jgi:hypothetical protein
MPASCVRRWGIGVGLAGGSAVAAALIGLSTAHAHADPTPDDPLTTAGTELTEGSTVLSGIDVSNDPDLASDVSNLVAVQNGALPNISTLELAESIISAHDGSLSSLVDQLYFDPLNQDWANTGESLLNADQGLATAVTDGTSLDSALVGYLDPGLQLLSVLSSTLFTADVATLF